MNLPIGNAYTPRSTPLHVSQLLRVYLEQTFSSFPDGHIFKFTRDLATTGIVFDTVFNKESKVYGTKPLILVSSDGYSYGNISQGDLASVHMQSMNARKTSLVNSATIIKVVGENYGTVDILANEVFNMLITARTILPRLTTIHQIIGISTAPINTFDEGDHKYYSQITLSYLLQYQWIHLIPENLLNSIVVNLEQKGNEENTRNIIIE